MYYGQKLILLLLGVCLFAAITAPSARAEIVPYDRNRAIQPPTPVDQVGLAFLRLGGSNPDFNELAQKTALIRGIPPEAQMDFIKTEAFRLQAKFAAFDPKKDVLVIRAPVNVQYTRKSDKTSLLSIKFPTDGAVYFPYYYADYPIAVIINGIENFTDMALAQDETAIVSATLESSFKATLLIELTPVSADNKRPMKLDRILQYPLLGNISYIGLLNSNAQQIWAWETPQSAKRSHRARDLSGLGVGAAAGN